MGCVGTCPVSDLSLEQGNAFASTLPPLQRLGSGKEQSAKVEGGPCALSKDYEKRSEPIFIPKPKFRLGTAEARADSSMKRGRFVTTIDIVGFGGAEKSISLSSSSNVQNCGERKAGLGSSSGSLSMSKEIKQCKKEVGVRDGRCWYLYKWPLQGFR